MPSWFLETRIILAYFICLVDNTNNTRVAETPSPRLSDIATDVPHRELSSELNTTVGEMNASDSVNHSFQPPSIPPKILNRTELTDIVGHEDGPHQVSSAPQHAEISHSKGAESPSDNITEVKEKESGPLFSSYGDWLQSLPSVPSPDLIDLPPFEPYRRPHSNSLFKISHVANLPPPRDSISEPELGMV